MPPKKDSGASKKVEQKKKEKIIEDKTFGLKNKKGTKNQKFIAKVQHQVQHGTQSAQKIKELEFAKKKKEVDELADLNKLLKPVADMPKVAKDVDPKSVLCLFFKQGLCQKGNKCKFSHDLAVEHKTEKRNLYVDSRDMDKQDNMDDWDEAKLNEVAETKHGEDDRKRANQTDIVCKYFLDAVENSKYGWFWSCPNGPKCIYRHALPPGFILKKDQKKLDEQKKADEISLEELIEKERAALSAKALTKITLESFIEWKKRKIKEKKQKFNDAEKKKLQNFKAGKQMGLSGRDLFTYNPDLVGDDDADAEDVAYYRREDDDDEDAMQEGTEGQKAFDIDDRMFSQFDDDIDEVDDEVEEGQATGANDANNPVVFNEDLFDADDVPDDDDEDDDSDSDDHPGPSKASPNADHIVNEVCEDVQRLHLNGDNHS